MKYKLLIVLVVVFLILSVIYILNNKNSGPSEISLKIFFSNNQLDPEISCVKVFPVLRQIGADNNRTNFYTAVLEFLLRGPGEKEKSTGYFTSINLGVKVQKISFQEGILNVDFSEELEREVGGSCRVSAIRAQIIETLKQFPEVKDVKISVNGRSEDILQP